MALTTCENCGAEISDTALKCPKCGKEMNKNKKENPMTGKKSWIILACIAAVVIIVAAGYRIIQNMNHIQLDSTEEYVLDCVRDLQKQKGDISLEDDILYSVSSKNDKTYVIVDFSSSDGDERAYFEDKVYIGTDRDYARLQNYDQDDVNAGIISRDEYKEILSQEVSFAAGNIEVAAWGFMNQMGNDINEDVMRMVSAEKIGDTLGIAYPKN